jgi:hypothetical protein
MKTSWAVILCKFTDGDVEPFPKQYYKNLFTVNNIGSPWNMIRYFSDYSHGTLDLKGTKIFGWYQLNKSVKNYNDLGSGARHELIKWARAAAVADGVDLTPFYSVVACCNLWHDIGTPSTRSGVVAQGTRQSRSYSVTRWATCTGCSTPESTGQPTITWIPGTS